MKRSLTHSPRSADEPHAVALNLSYVLHAPSGSAQVASYLRRRQSAIRSVSHAGEQLAQLDDDALRHRTVRYPYPQPMEPEVSPGQRVVSLQLGPWELLPRVLGLLTGTRPSTVTLLDNRAPDMSETVFFRAPALLNLPEPDRLPGWFVSLTLRPGSESLLLELRPAASLSELVVLAEDAVRRAVEQWRCGHALWRVPAENALPEFRDLVRD